MAIEPNYEKVVSSERKKLGVTQSVIEWRLPSDDVNDVLKVLCANAKSFILDSSVKSGEIEFNGNVNFQVIYENLNKEKVDAADLISLFQKEIEFSNFFFIKISSYYASYFNKCFCITNI